MKLLIADDEDIIREGLLSNIPWEESGFQLTTPGKNGKDAMTIIELEHPDIVLADINMPFMSGLELADWINQNHPEIKVIFLTGYDEFQYAKKAIDLKASGYILKYEKWELLLQKVKNVADELIKNRQGESLKNQAKRQLIFSTISDLIIGTARISSQAAVMERLGLPNSNYKYCLALIDVSLDTPVKEDKPNENELYLFSYINVVREVCTGFFKNVLCSSYDYQVYALFALENQSNEELIPSIKTALAETNKKLQDFLKAYGKIGVSNLYDDIFQTDEAYNSAYKALQSIKNIEDENIAFIDDFNHNLMSGNAIMKEISDFIQNNYQIAGLSLNDLAESIHLSPSHLCRLIKRYKHSNFMTWLTQVRIELAAEMIRTTDKKIYEICENVGYNNPQYFSVVFKKYMGCSPREYK